MPKIDIHTHILPPSIPKFKEIFGYGGFVELEHVNESCGCYANMVKDDGTFFRKVYPNCYDVDARLKEMAKTRVDMQVLSTVPVMFNYHIRPKDGLYVAQYLNDHIAQTVAKYPQKFLGLGTVPLQDVALSVSECRRIKESCQLSGVQIGSNINQKNLDNESLYPFYEALCENNLSLFIHPWDMLGKKELSNYWLAWLVGMPAETTRAICSMIFGGVFDRFPDLKVCFAHGGGAFPFTLGRISHGHKVRPDLCAVKNPKDPAHYLGKFFVDSLVHDISSLKFLLAAVGEDNIMLGSDYPFPLGEHFPGELIEKYCTDKSVQKKLMFENALKWLNLSDAQFTRGISVTRSLLSQ